MPYALAPARQAADGLLHERPTVSAEQVGNMGYMSRLGLWGRGTAFADFQAFFDSMKKRGVSFLELLAMEMKAEGFYLARSLSFRCVLRGRA